MAEVKVELPSLVLSTTGTPASTNDTKESPTSGVNLSINNSGDNVALSIVPPPLLPSPLASQSYAHDDQHDGDNERVGLIIHPAPRVPNNDGRPATHPDVLASMVRSEEELKAMKPAVREFYTKQNAIIDGLVQVHELNIPTSRRKKSEADNSAWSTFAIRFSFGINVCLFGVKLFAAIYSGSLSVIAGALDSFLDLASGSMIFFVSRAMKKHEPLKYPVSKSRMEPLGVLVFAAIMALASVQVIQESVQVLIDGATGTPREIKVDDITIGVLCATIGTKFLLFLFCTWVGTTSGLVEALAQDHFNDVKTNSIALAAAIVASRVKSLWWMDGAGAIALSCWIIITWIRSGSVQAGKLAGKSSDPELIGQLAYLAATHDARIQRVDKVLSYHYGVREMVEVDVILPETMSLKEAHDIGDALERKIEQLPEIERAFVHLDYEFLHKPEHKIIIED